MTKIRVGVFGAGGRMGSTVCRAVQDDPDLELVAAVDPHYAGLEVSGVTGAADNEVMISGDRETLGDAGVEVAIDFTNYQPSLENLAYLAGAGIHAVVGTTGFSEEDLARFAAEFTRSNCLIAPNFAIGALLMMKFAEQAAPYFETAEIIEFHHDEKIDAPSGTATLTAERMARASNDWGDDPTTKTVYEGARGGEGPAGIRVHSVRMRGMVAHQEVILGTTGQTLVLRHDSIDRTSFMPGVLMATKAIGERPGLTVGLDVLLDL
ncbi:MAG: 4-hydroxy-tetrahydrodipicolinate reductase [Microthrixaceae bacterium]|nr:4-hydroxy-tetrahydrodipicolinate reductase [Microthrixaceae bacterium]